MANLVSPGVGVQETDITTVIPATSSSTAAFSGAFVWGPVNSVTRLSNELQLASTFGAPDSNTYVSFLTCSSFLAYGNDLRVVRSANSNTYNAQSNTTTQAIQIANPNIYHDTFKDNSNLYYIQGEFAAKYPGALGNSITVQVWDTGNTASFKTWAYSGQFNGVPGTSTFAAQNGSLNDEFHLVVIDSNGSFTGIKGAVLETYPYLSKAYDAIDGNGVTTYYKNVIESRSNYIYAMAPVDYANTSTTWGSKTISNIVFAKSGTQGVVTGNTYVQGGVYTISTVGNTAYNLISTGVDIAGNTNGPVVGKTFTVTANSTVIAASISNSANGNCIINAATSLTFPLTKGTDALVSDANKIAGYGLFANKDTVPASLVITGDASPTVQGWIISNITTPTNAVTSTGATIGRAGDALSFISPPYAAVVNTAGNEVTNITSWLYDANTSTSFGGTAGLGGGYFSSYVVADSGWKYMFDKYNNVYRWVPLNGDIAGLCAFTDQVNDPWWSPAGFNRGNIKNAVKLAWSPSQAQRDQIYPMGVNPVAAFPGNGIVLFGDKTLQAKPSAFDRINVRRLFMVLEASIAKAAKYSLFQFNDSFTQNQFLSMVVPFLTNIQARRGITDFKVICDSTNNTGYVVDNNQFVADIYIKPARSINYITLNFVAVGTSVAFSTIVGS